jgi:hypothetical protein
MKTLRKKLGVWVMVACAGLALTAIATGCQTQRRHAAMQKKEAMCPLCQMETRTTPADGLVYTKHVCPGCRTIRNTGTSDEAADLTEVHVCDRCKMTVDKCPMCVKR